MATATEYLGLTKPTEEEYVSVDVINENMEKIDEEAREARPVKKGGTGKTSWAANRIIYASAAEVLAQIAFPTTAGSFLRQDKSGAPYWSTPEQVLAAIGAMPLYKYLSEIGLTAGSETIESIFNAMPTYSMLEINCTSGWTNTSIYPETEGTLTVYKQETHRATFRFVTAYGTGVYEGAYAGTWSGWKQVLYADGSIVMTGALSTSSDGTGIGTYAGNTAGAFIECFKGDWSNRRQLLMYNPQYMADITHAVQIVDVANSKNYIIHGEHNKPKGKYTGNGSSAQRSINIPNAIGQLLFIYSYVSGKQTWAIVSKTGGVGMKTDGTLVSFKLDKARFSQGDTSCTMVLNTTDEFLNTNGIEYDYEVI